MARNRVQGKVALAVAELVENCAAIRKGQNTQSVVTESLPSGAFFAPVILIPSPSTASTAASSSSSVFFSRAERRAEARARAACSSQSAASARRRRRRRRKRTKKRIAFAGPLTSMVCRDFVVREPSSNYWTVRAAIAGSKKSNAALAWNCLRLNRADGKHMRLSHGGRRCLETPNAGGTSEWSEAISFEILRNLYSAELLRTEMEIDYEPGSKITDFAVRMFDVHLGVSVTRAMAWVGSFTEADALRLLHKKLYGVIRSSDGVIPEHRWDKQILHVLAEEPYITDVLIAAYHKLDPSIRADTLVIITSCCSNGIFMF